MTAPKRLRIPERDDIAALFDQAMLMSWDENRKGAWLDTLESFTKLLAVEFQWQVAAYKRSPRTGEVYKRRTPNYGEPF